MKIQVTILYKPHTLNPQDRVVLKALEQIGHTEVVGIHVGRYFEFEVDGSRTATEWVAEVENICKDPRLNLVSYNLEECKITVIP